MRASEQQHVERERERERGRRKGAKITQRQQTHLIHRRGRRNGQKKTATEGPNRVGKSTDMGETMKKKGREKKEEDRRKRSVPSGLSEFQQAELWGLLR